MSACPALVLVHPGHRTAIYQSLGVSLSAIEPPVWAGLIATFVQRHGHEVAIVDCEAENIGAEQAADRIADVNPRLAAVVVYGHQPSASTQNMTMAGEICRAIKARTDVPVLMLGGHVAALPERTLAEEAVDFVADGEGPVTVLELLDALESESPRFDRVRGLSYHDGDAVRRTPPAPLVTDLDEEMPRPAWDLLPMPAYRAHNWHTFGYASRQPYAALYTSLGCPYHCAFCCIQAPFKSGEATLGYAAAVNSYRRWKPETVVATIDGLVSEYGVTHLKLADEMFVLHRAHVERICRLLADRRHDLNMWAYARVDTVGDDDRMLDLLRAAGVRWLAFGIESAVDRVRDQAGKPLDQEEILGTLARVRAAGIHVVANFIFGLPEDTMESMQATLALALETNCEYANFNTAMAYPGSALYSTAVERGWQLPDRWSGYSQHSTDTLPLATETLTSADVLRFRDRAWDTYFNRASYTDMMEQRFGPAVRSQIAEMTAHRLVRQHV